MDGTTTEQAARPRLKPVLIRLDPQVHARLRRLCTRTRVAQGVYLREAIADLLAKYSGALEDER